MRISTTTLEAFRLWRDERRHDGAPVVSEADLQAGIRGERVTTPRMQLGIAYGEVLADPAAHAVIGGYWWPRPPDPDDDAAASYRPIYRFEAATIEPALRGIDRRGLFEVKATKRYGVHTVVAKADHVRGARVGEFKTRIGDINLERYARSYQWRFLIDLFRAHVVTYQVFQLTEQPIALTAIEELPVYPYAALPDDCAALVDSFVSYVYDRRLEAYLPDRYEPLEGPVIEDSPTRPSPTRAPWREPIWLRTWTPGPARPTPARGRVQLGLF